MAGKWVNRGQDIKTFSPVTSIGLENYRMENVGLKKFRLTTTSLRLGEIGSCSLLLRFKLITRKFHSPSGGRRPITRCMLLLSPAVGKGTIWQLHFTTVLFIRLICHKISQAQ